MSELSRRSGVDQGAISRLEAGLALPSARSLVALAEALGGRFSVRLYPGTGPRLRDSLQAPMIEALIAPLHARWRPVLEVPVYSPVRGVIDLALVDRLAPEVVATEAHSAIRRLEQQLRWAAEKSDALKSSRLWGEVPSESRIGRLLLLRSTRATREIVRRHAATLAAAYPAPISEAHRSLFDGADWPGHAILWSEVSGGVASILDRPPRGIHVGRR